jgi:hypothetical protein
MKEIRKTEKEKEENKIKKRGRRERFGPVSKSARSPGRKPEAVSLCSLLASLTCGPH